MSDDGEALRLVKQLQKVERDAMALIAAMVELAGGEVRVPRRLIVDPPELLMVDDPTGDDDWRIFRTRRVTDTLTDTAQSKESSDEGKSGPS